MPDKKDDGNKGGGIPLWLGQAAALTGGGILGKQGGEALAHLGSEHLDFSESTAHTLENGLELTGAAVVAFAGLKLAEQNPNKSLFVGAKALAGAAAVVGAEKVIEEVTALRTETAEQHTEMTALHQEVHHMIDLFKTDDDGSNTSLFNNTAQPEPAWKDTFGNWSDRDPLTQERPHDIFHNPLGADIFGHSHDSNGQLIEHNDHSVADNHASGSAFDDHPSSDI